MTAYSAFILYFLIVFYGRIASFSALSQLPLLFFLLVLICEFFSKQKPLYSLFISLFTISVLISSFVNGISWLNTLIFLGINSSAFAAVAVMRSQRSSSFNTIKRWILAMILLGSTLALLQSTYVRSPDFVRGLFISLGNGAHVFTAITILYITAIYFYPNILPVWIRRPWRRLLLTIYCLYSATLSDGKQVFLVLIISLSVPIIIFLFKNTSLRKRFYLLGSTVFVLMLSYFSVRFGFLKIGWIDQSDLVIRGLKLKFSIFEIIHESDHSLFAELFGTGPGMLSSRLALMLPDYASLLDPSFITISPLTEQILYFQESNYVTNTSTGSSLFSLTFSFSAFFGEIGFFGTCFYLLAISNIIYFYKTSSSIYFSIFFLIYYCTLGVVYQYWEEPIFVFFAFMVYVFICRLESTKAKLSI